MAIEPSFEVEGKTLKEAVENACREMGVGKAELEYKLCTEHFRGGAETVRIVAWRIGNGVEEHVEEHVEEEATESIQSLLEGILERMGLEGSAKIRTDGSTIRVALTLEDQSGMAEKGSRLLDALQHLVNKSLNREKKIGRVVIDVENYREKHDQNITYVAKMVCEKVLKEACVVTLKPMNAYDRRLVHMHVASYPDLGSRSEGEGQMKRVQVFMAPAHVTD